MEQNQKPQNSFCGFFHVLSFINKYRRRSLISPNAKKQMNIISTLLIGIVAIEHFFILWLEMFAWETKGKKVFKGSLSEDLFKPTKKLAANQGLYNGFLAAGLCWTFFIENEVWKTNIAIFFLGCIIVAGCYGAMTASRKIFFVQALPAIIALAFLLAK